MLRDGLTLGLVFHPPVSFLVSDFEMDEPLSLESTSLFSSIADAPLRMEKQYAPLAQVFYEHSTELPDQSLPEPNSEGILVCMFVCNM